MKKNPKIKSSPLAIQQFALWVFVVMLLNTAIFLLLVKTITTQEIVEEAKKYGVQEVVVEELTKNIPWSEQTHKHYVRATINDQPYYVWVPKSVFTELTDGDTITVTKSEKPQYVSPDALKTINKEKKA